MSIYDLPVATATRPGRLRGRSIYDNAGYAAPPIGLGNLPSLAAPTMRVAGGAASIYDTPNLPPMQPVPGADQAGPAAMGPPVDPDDPSLFAQARDVGLGGLSMLGNLLDIPGSMVRDALTWIPGGIAARNPLDQLLSPLSDQNRTTGEELLRLDEWQPDSWYGSVGKFGAGMAAEIALDPLTYMTLGGTALTKMGGQLASRAGMMGDAVSVANRKLAAQAAEAGTDAVTVGAREARQLVNPRELAANLDEASRRKFRDGTTGDILDDAVETVAHTDGHPIGVEELVRSYNGMNARAIKAGEMPAASLSDDMIDAFRTGTASTDDLLAQSNIPADYLDEAIGGNFRFKVPFANKPINIPFTDRAIPDEFVFNDLRLPIPGKARELGGLGARAIGDLPIPKTDKRIQDLIPDFARDLPGMAADGRIEGRTIARAMDKTADAVMNNRPMLTVSSMFDRVGREAKHKLSRAAARESAQRGEEMARVVREEAAGPMADADKKMQAYSRTEGVTQQDVLDTQFDILDRMEGALTDDQLSPVAAQFQPAMDFFTNAFRTQADQAEAFGQNQQRLREGISYEVPKVNPDGTEVLGKDGKPEIEKVVLQSPIEYVPRNRQNESGVMRRVGNAMSKSGRMIQPDGFTKGRDEAMRHLRTSQIQRMSLDKKFAGRADRGVLGGKRSRELAAGNTGQFPDTGVMGSSLLERDTPEWEQAYSAFKKAYPPAKDYMRLAERGELKDINGNLVEWSPALDEALDDKHRQLFSKITQLDRAQVERGVPMFDTNVFQAGLNRLESGYQSAAQELGTRKLLSTSARLAKPRPVAEQSAAPTSKLASTSGRNIDSMNLLGENGENLERLGLNHDRGKQKLLGELAEQGHDIDGMAESIMAPKRDKIATELTELIARNSDTPIADLQGPIREALDNDPDSLLAAITTDEAMQERIGKLVDKYTNVEAKPDDILKKFEIDADLGNDMMAVNTRFSTPEEIKAFTEALDAFTNMFKTNVTAAFPSFHTRNLFSAMMQNALNGVTDTSATRLRDRFFKPYSDARKVINGEVLADANQLPGMEKLSPEEATEKFRDEIFAQKIIDATGDHNDIPGLPSGGAIDARPGQSRGRAANLPESKGWDLVEKIPFARNFARNVREASLPPKKTRWRDTFNPLESSAVRGTREGTVKYGGERIGRALGNEIESTVRIAPYIAFRRQGFTASEAAKKVKSLQVDYNDLTRTERKVMRRAAPFYSFNKGATKYLAGELSTRPGGPVAMTIKAAENASGNDPGTPEYIRDGLNIPLGGAAEDGSRNYLTGAGLMHEPPAQLLGNNIQETFYNAASMAHPIPKALIEYITDESLFLRDGKGGGRDLDDIDPPVGGTLRNIGQFTGLLDKERRSPIDLPIPFEKEFELAVANSPAARYLSQIRKATDNRKNPLEKLLNGLTGFNVATVEPNDRDAVLREQLEQLLRDMGGRTFSQAYMPDTTLAEMGMSQQDQVAKIKEALRQINARRRNSSD